MAGPVTPYSDNLKDKLRHCQPRDGGLALSTNKLDREPGALTQELQHTSSHTKRIRYEWLKWAVYLTLALLVQRFRLHWISGQPGSISLDNLCPQVEEIVSPRHKSLLESLDKEFGSFDFKLKAYESLGGAIRIPTESYDDHGFPSEDPRWEVEAILHQYLESCFSRVHANLKRTKVNTYALVYEWKGTKDSKPLLLTAHMDVVPVNPETFDDWVHPPYSGYYDGEWIWGRGSCDDKPALIGILTAIESLLERGFVPSRTVLLAFGSDEERGGPAGAREIANYLLGKYGYNSLAMIVDEGEGYSERNGTVFAPPAIAEKGCMDIRMGVLTPGGHSSLPPKHTGIGILAKLITELEAHPHKPELVRGTAYYQGLECRARHDTSFSASLKELVLQSQTSDEKLRELEDRLIDFDPKFYALSGTTQAIDLVGGGIKVNALPEDAWAVVNHRIAEHNSLSELMSRFINITLPVAEKYNMSFEAFGEILSHSEPSWGTIRLEVAFNHSLVSLPVTPTTGSGPYELLSGTILSTLRTHLCTSRYPKTAVVIPGIMYGNTDTRHYWNLSKHIFRYDHWDIADAYNELHTVNEGWIGSSLHGQITDFILQQFGQKGSWGRFDSSPG